MKHRILGAVLLCLGGATFLLPRFWNLEDTYGDNAHIAQTIGMALLIFGLAFLLNITYWGSQMSAKKSGLVMLSLGGVLTLSAMILPALFLDTKKAGALLLPLLLAGLSLVGIGTTRHVIARNAMPSLENRKP
jgi:hypothetical protein